MEYHDENYEVRVTIDKETGRKLSERWTLDGVEHNPFGPARILYNDNGDPTLICYLLNGVHHRDGGPAIMHFDLQTGELLSETYYKHGKKHNSKGPAEIFHDASVGKIRSRQYYLEGERIRAKEWDGPT